MASEHSSTGLWMGDASPMNENNDASTNLEEMGTPTRGDIEQKDSIHNGKQAHSSYISSCSDSSLSYENDSEKVAVNRNTGQRHSKTSSDNRKVNMREEEVRGRNPPELIADSDQGNSIGKDGDSCNTELPPKVLYSRVQSLESQLLALERQLSNVLAAIESNSKNRKRLAAAVPKVQRVSSMLLNDLNESSDIEQEMANIEEESSQQKRGRDSSPAPNLEYRSYTPTYEEEILKYRKTSRGMSIDNTHETDSKSAENKIIPKINSSEVPRTFETKKVTKPMSPMQSNVNVDDENAKETILNSSMDHLDGTVSQTAASNHNNDTKYTEEKSDEVKNRLFDDFSDVNKTFGFFEMKWKAILAFFDSLNLDSRQHDGSATEDVDANMEEFLRVPWRIEELMSFGTLICADAFLHVLTVTPLKFIWSCICLLCTVLFPGKGIGLCRFHRRHLYQFVRVFVIYAVYKYCLSPISIGKMYHWIRGQAMLKLYVLMAMVEVFDRLMCSFGQDALDSLFWNTTRRPFHKRMLLSVLVVLGYAIIHSYILFVHVATLNVAMNSADQTLLTLLISGNFAEIKSTVFKKYNKQNLFKIVSSDICERFKLVLFLGLVLLLNCSQGGMNQEMVNEYIHMSLLILFAEILCDWIKHSFITKFNFIKSSAYQDYALILAGDITGVGQDGPNIDHTHKVVKRLGFAQIPVACVMARYVAEAVRYADNLSEDGDSNHVLYSIAVILSRGTWSQVGSRVLIVFIALSILKVILGRVIDNISHRVILFGPEPEEDSTHASTSKPVQRRQAA